MIMNTDTLLPLAINLLAKSSGVLILAFAVQPLWKNASSAHRCLVWGAAFTVLALLPLTLLVPPQWSLALDSPQTESSVSTQVVAFPQAQMLNEVVKHEPASRSWHFPQISAAQAGFGLWLIGAVLALGWRMVGAWQVRQLRQQSARLEDRLVSALTIRIAAELGITRTIEVRESQHVPVPLTWGVFRPVVLLPHSAHSWDDAALQAALRHELGHILHQDAATRWCMTLVCAVLWPNPLVWLAARAWRTAQEQACDDVVVRAGMAAQDYALQLINAARAMKVSPWPPASVLAMAKPSTLETRLSAIMDPSKDRRPVNRNAWMVGSIATLTVFTFCTALQVRAQDKTPKAGKSNSAIEISSQLLEVQWKPGSPILDKTAPAPGERVFMTTEQAKNFVSNLMKQKGVSLVTPPVVTARSGQPASLKVVRDFGGKVDSLPKVGVFLDFLPHLAEKGEVTVATRGLVREFNGFRNDGKNTRSPVWLEYPVKQANTKSGKTTIFAVAPDKQSPEVHRRYLFVISARLVPNIEIADIYDQGTLTLEMDGTSIASMKRTYDPAADQYFAAYMLCKSGEKLEKQSDKEGALQKFRAAQKAFKAIAQANPEWQTSMVAYRLKVIDAAVTRLSNSTTSKP